MLIVTKKQKNKNMKTIKALVVFPIEVEIEVIDNATKEQVINLLADEADRILQQTSIVPLIQDSVTNPELIGLSCKHQIRYFKLRNQINNLESI